MTDISSGLENVLGLVFNGLKFCFDTLDSISFRGISLLDFTIWVFVLGIILPIIVTLLNSGRSEVRSYAKSEYLYEKRRSQREAERSKK